MARFIDGNWQRNEIAVWPVGKRRFFGWAFPYQSGDKVEFEIEITHGETSKSLYELPVNALNVATNEYTRVKFEKDKSTKATIDRYSISSAGALEFWVGVPSSSSSIQLVYADTWNPTTIIVAIATGVLSAVITWLILGT